MENQLINIEFINGTLKAIVRINDLFIHVELSDEELQPLSDFLFFKASKKLDDSYKKKFSFNKRTGNLDVE